MFLHLQRQEQTDPFLQQRQRLKVKADEEFTINIALNKTSDTPAGAIDFTVNLPSGLEYVSHELGNLDAYMLKSFTSGTGVFTASMTSSGTTSDIQVLSLTLKAKNTDLGENTISFTSFSIGDITGSGTLDYGSMDSITINTYSELTGDFPIEITAPAKGGIPQATITEGTGYTGTITWDGSPLVFAPETTYSAKVELTAKTGYVFASDATASVSGSSSITKKLLLMMEASCHSRCLSLQP